MARPPSFISLTPHLAPAQTLVSVPSRGQLLARSAPIQDSFEDLPSLLAALRRRGLESSRLIMATDFTKSNRWNGVRTFGGRSLHALSPPPLLNPYEEALSIIGATLREFDDENLIAAFGFGCARTHDRAVFSFNAGERPCRGFEDVLARYRALAPSVLLSGPTNFAPVIYKAMRLVQKSGGHYHILLIVGDGQVDTESAEEATLGAIVAASAFPLSIIFVGVGDGNKEGGWDAMRRFDDRIPARSFDNFQTLVFSEIMAKAAAQLPRGVSAEGAQAVRESCFALHALMEVPEQFEFIVKNRLRDNVASATIPSVLTLPPIDTAQADAPSSQLGGVVVRGPAAPLNIAASPTTAPTSAAAEPQVQRGAMLSLQPASPTSRSQHPNFTTTSLRIPASSPALASAPTRTSLAATAAAAAATLEEQRRHALIEAEARQQAEAAEAEAVANRRRLLEVGEEVRRVRKEAEAMKAEAQAARVTATAAQAMADKIKEQSTCSVCLDALRSVAFVPCGHAVCRDCDGALNRRQLPCPQCRAPIERRLQLFL